MRDVSILRPSYRKGESLKLIIKALFDCAALEAIPDTKRHTVLVFHCMKENADDKPTVPNQEEGTKKDIDYSVKAVDENEARQLYSIARTRLADVNHWKDFSGPASASFCLTDSQGRELTRSVHEGDLFRIALPAPGPAEGKGYDWVRVEAIEESRDSHGEKESIAIRVRPTQSPLTEGNETAHFFNEKATSSFVVERNGNNVTAAVYGRNEVPNTETSNIIDKVRNAIVGSTAILGFSNVQWKSLVKGLLETKD